MRAVLLDHAGRSDRCRDVGRPADHGRFAVQRRDIRDAVHAVLQRQNRRRRTEHRSDHRERRLVVVGLDRNDHQIHRADLRRIVFRGRLDDEVAERRAAHLESTLADRGQVRAARDERHVVPGARQPRTVVPAHAAGSKNRDLHERAAL